MDDLAKKVEIQQAKIDHLTHELFVVKSLVEYERSRLDYALAIQAGMDNLRERLIEERKTPHFNGAFSKSEPLVSVCVATYNRSSLLLSRCIASLQRQSYRNLQIVVVGDACTDDTERSLGRMRDGRIVFQNRSQRGPYPAPSLARWRVAGTNAMNDALDLAEGDFICHLDDDDEALFDRVEGCLKAVVDNKAEFLWHKFYHQKPDATWSILGTKDVVSGQITTGSTFYHRFFRAVKWDVNAFRLGEPGDWNRVRRLMHLRPRSFHLDKVLMRHFRENSQSGSSSSVDEEEYLS